MREEEDDYRVKRLNLSQGSRREVSTASGKDYSPTFCSTSCLSVLLVPSCYLPLCWSAYLVRRGPGVCGRRGDGAESCCAEQQGQRWRSCTHLCSLQFCSAAACWPARAVAARWSGLAADQHSADC